VPIDPARHGMLRVRSKVVSLSAVATFPAIAFLVVVHGAVLAGLFAIRLVPRK
jgi:hypothetical protein